MPEQSPRVSAIVPAYNSVRYLPEAIDSVLAQTYRDFEIIVVDDGSTDGTQGVLARYGDRIRVVRQSNQGSAAARNAGILAARGEFIAFLDADDLWLPQKLERQMRLFGERPEIGWVYSDYREFDESGLGTRSFFEREGLRHPPEGWVLPALAEGCITWTTTVVMRASCFHEAGLFDPVFPRAQDYDMWLRLAARFPVACVAEVLALYRRHQAQVTTKSRPGLVHCHTWRVLNKFIRAEYRGLQPDVRQQVDRVLQARLAAHACRVGQVALSFGHRLEALRWHSRAVVASLRDPLGRRRLLPWYCGQLLDSVLPPCVMDGTRELKRRAARLVQPAVPPLLGETNPGPERPS
jgi:GT2 family glycosyltransferase